MDYRCETTDGKYFAAINDGAELDRRECSTKFAAMELRDKARAQRVKKFEHVDNPLVVDGELQKPAAAKLEPKPEAPKVEPEPKSDSQPEPKPAVIEQPPAAAMVSHSTTTTRTTTAPEAVDRQKHNEARVKDEAANTTADTEAEAKKNPAKPEKARMPSKPEAPKPKKFEPHKPWAGKKV